jgi:hypothetical protein
LLLEFKAMLRIGGVMLETSTQFINGLAIVQ